ncbi:MAG: PAS domain-containing protein [Pseudomonadota bacterium]
MTIEYPSVDRLFDALPVCIAYVDDSVRYGILNATYERWFELPAAQVIGRTVREVVAETAYARIRPHLKGALAGDRREFEDEMSYAQGGTRFVSATYVPDRAPEGRVAGFHDVISETSDRKLLEREVAKAAVEEQQRIGRGKQRT